VSGTYKNIVSLFLSKNTFVFALCLSVLLFGRSYAQTEEAAVADTSNPPVISEAPEDNTGLASVDAGLSPIYEEKISRDRFNPKEYESLVFTHWEQAAIDEARNQRGSVRPVTDYELEQAMNQSDVRAPEVRDISLGGIVYHAKDDWTIWLNKKRVTPTALPKEVIDLQVFSEYIEMKWYDESTNQIFPIRLRTHQRFNIDARMFLPG